MPSYIDDERQTITMTCVEKGKSSLPSFVLFDTFTSTFYFNPLTSNKAGSYTIQVTLADSFGETNSYSFDVIVNEAPK